MFIIDRLLAVVAPHDCLQCGAEGAILCATCLTALPSAEAVNSSGISLQTVRIATTYGKTTQALLWKLKNGGSVESIRIMAELMAQRFEAELSKNTVFVPVPTAGVRARRRGFDQAVMLASLLGKRLHRPFGRHLMRLGNTRQVGASRKQRRVQLRGSFVARRGLDPGQRYVLVDDVMTTGATLETAAHALRLAGAKDIEAMVFARPD